jgi:DNA-directed RNA polymerase beta subunit
MVKPDTGEKIEIFVGGEDGTKYELLPPIIKDENNENVGMLPNNARIYDLNYNATISATLLVRHYDGKEKEFEINKVDIASFPIMLHLYLCASRPITKC